MMKFPEDFKERPHPDTQRRLADKNNSDATPFGDIDLFKKGEQNHNTQERIASKEFEELLKKAEEVGKLSPMEIGKVLMKLTELERNHKEKLQNLAKKIIQKELGLSQDIIDNISATLLTQEINPGEEIKPVIDDFDNEGGGDGDDETPLEKLGLTQEEVNKLVGEVQVRKIMNSMIMGGGYKLFDVLKDFKTELDGIDRRLYPSYIVLNPNANLMHWMMPSNNIGGRMVAGSVKLKFDKPENEDEEEQEQNNEEIPKVVKVEAKATNFAVLLHEIAKGALEYLFSIRLAGFSENLSRAITDVADDYEAEHFHKLLGPQIWKQFFYGIEIALEQYSERNELYGINSSREMLPLIINKISTLKTQDFIDLVDDMLNPGEAQKNRREEPLDRIKKIIHSINMDIKEFMDEQDGKGGHIDLGHPNHEIDQAINHKKHDWVDDLENKVMNGEEAHSDVDYDSMSKIELADALADALEKEDYDLAAKIRDLINKK